MKATHESSESDTAIRFALDGASECLLCHAKPFLREASPELRAALSLEWAKAHHCSPAPEASGLVYLRNRGIGLPTSAKGDA